MPNKTTFDLILIQPPVMRPIVQEDPTIQRYFDALGKVASFLGDSPVEPNLGLLMIASAVQKEFPDWKIKIIDLNLLERQIRRTENRPITIHDINTYMNVFRTRSIGISFMTSTYGLWGRPLCELCNTLFHNPTIIVGGVHPTVCYKQVMKECDGLIDYIVVGQGEYAFVELLRTVVDNPRIIRDVPHVYTKHHNGRDITRAQLTSHQLGQLPTPDYSLYPEDARPYVFRIYTERGCTKQCSFCSVSEFFEGQKYSTIPVPVDKVLNDIKLILDTYDIDHMVIGDLSMFNQALQDRDFVSQLAKVSSKNKLRSNWWCQTRGDLLDDHTIRLLSEAGCKQVAIGCEAGTDKQLDRIQKGENCQSIKSSLAKLRGMDIQTQCYWVIGLPGDDLNDIRSTQKLILQYLNEGLTTLTHITVLVPYPNTPAFKQEKIHGIKIDHNDWSRYWMNCDPFGCDIPAYHTVDRNGKTLLTSQAIYDVWLETIGKVADFYESKT